MYDELFDYSFDQCDNIKDRVTGIVNNISRLKDILSSSDERLKMYEILKPKLQRNRTRIEDVTSMPDIGIPSSLNILFTDQSCVLYGQQKSMEVIWKIKEMVSYNLEWKTIE